MDTFLIVLALGAAAIAVWMDARFERLGPRTLRRALLHVSLALVVGWAVVPPAIGTVMDAGAGPLLALLATALPALVYLFLATFWTLRHAQSSLSRR